MRAGQAAFNTLYMVRPDMADQIRGGALDPFYVDDRLPAFWDWIQSQTGDDRPVTKDGTVLTDEQIQAYADEAERGYDPAMLRPRRDKCSQETGTKG